MTEKRFNDALNAGRDEPYTLAVCGKTSLERRGGDSVVP